MSISLDAKKIVKAMNLIALMAFFMIYSFDAFSQVRRRRQPVPNPYPRSVNQVQVIKAKLFGQVIHGPSIINLKKIIKDQNPRTVLQGQNLQAVVVKGVNLNYYGRGAVQLIINNQIIGRPVSLRQYDDKIVLPVLGRSILGRDIQSIKLKVLGTIKIKMVGLRVKNRAIIAIEPGRRRGRY